MARGLAPWILMAVTGCTAILPFEDIEESGQARCANGIDDDHDDRVDCDDPDCAGHCAEASASACRNGWDDDGDGYVDADETSCWPHVEVSVGPPGASDRCSTIASTGVRLDPGAAPWSWSDCEETCAAAHPFGPDPTDASAEPVAHIEGGESCFGSGVLASSCQQGVAPSPSTGGPCWTLDADIYLEDGAEIVFVMGPEVRSPLLRTPESARVAVSRRGASVALSYVTDGEPTDGTTTTPEGWLHLHVEASGADGARGRCQAGAYGAVTLRLEPILGGDAVILERDARSRVPLRPPLAWRVDDPIAVGLTAAAPPSAWVRALRLDREAYHPCGHRVPQIAGEDDGPAVVVGAARGGGRVCVIGATADGPEVERVYDPHLDQGTPPQLRPEDPPPAGRRFASWHGEDLGVASFTAGVVEGPARSEALEGRHVRAGELTWADDHFEGILLVGDDPRAGGRLVRIVSPDCERWTVGSFDDPVPSARPLHPISYELTPARRLILAEPAGGYAAGDDRMRCPGRELPEYGFVAEPDPVPRIKAVRSECLPYPRAQLLDAVSSDGRRWSLAETSLLPAFPRWVVRCGCISFSEDTPERSYPSEVTQLLERGGAPAFVASGRAGVEIVVDEHPGSDADPSTADAALVTPTLLRPSERAATFDEARVGDGHLLLLGRARSDCPPMGLLFYRGFARVETDGEAGLIHSFGGQVGVLPISFGEDGTIVARDGGADSSCAVGPRGG